MLDLTALKNSFSGEVITSEDTEYQTASTTFTHQGTPLVVLRPRRVEDVVAATRFAQAQQLTLSVRSGGHSNPGFGTNDGGIVIDLLHLNEVTVLDAETRLVKVGAGATWGLVADALSNHGLAISSGDTRSVGVGGLTLGGGIGWMVRKYGLTIDSLVAAEIVTADGQVLRVSESENPGLFWAIRGGGGNFGVVTYFEFRAQPISYVHTATITYSLENLAQVLKGWRDYLRSAPEELTSNCMLMPNFMGNPPAFLVMCCFVSDDEVVASKAFQPLLELGSIVKQDIERKKYAEALEEAHKPEGIKIISRTAFVNDFSDEMLAKVVELYGKEGSPMFLMRSLGGAMNRVSTEATAFAHRNKELMIASVGFVPIDAPASAAEGALKTWQQIEPFTEGAYSNFLYEVDEKDIPRVYPPATLQRLVAVKKQYDAQNLFNQNYNIKP